MKNENLIFGLDIGIGSVGWAVVRTGDNARIEDCGVRVFDSGEQTFQSDRKSQQRRGFRATRRLVRRRKHRKERLKAYLQKCGLLSVRAIDAYYEQPVDNPLVLREKGLSEQLTPEQIAACLIHISNYRGYREFYELHDEDLAAMSNQEMKEYKSEKAGIDEVRRLMEEGGYQTAAEFFLHDPHFTNDASNFTNYHNHSYKSEVFPVSRKTIKAEAEMILRCQQKWYTCLNDHSIEDIISIIFAQRDFEDGPGDKNDDTRPYTGFLGSLGKCMYYSEEDRGFRYTVLGDLYALVNVLSQYTYVNTDTGELDFSASAAQEILCYALEHAELKNTDLNKILKKHKLKQFKLASKGDSKATLGGSFRYMKAVKDILESVGFVWSELTGGMDAVLEQRKDMLYQIGAVLSKYQTPSRRVKELKGIKGVDDHLANRLAQKKISGTAKVSERYMAEAVRAFCNGEIYGNFQARMLKARDFAYDTDSTQRTKKLPPFSKDEEFYRNPVVLRSLNETRKIINALVERYGSPYAINVEVASEVGRSYEEQKGIEREQEKNRKKRESVKKQIAQMLNILEEDVRPTSVERFLLGEQQGWKCLYSGKPIDQIAALSANNKSYEVDHIVPFSLILDDSRQNKALVLAHENQLKKQRTPLMYLTGDWETAFKERVNDLYKQNKISRKKYDYLMLPDLYSPKAHEKLDEWKSRNLNDTRYISKYIVGYLRDHLLFDRGNDDGDPVFAVKGAITSRFRREWLNESTWGKEEKERDDNHLHHAADAIVIANCTRKQVELASDNMKLYRMLKSSRGVETEEYKDYLRRAINKMVKYYHMDPREAEQRLRSNKRNTVSLLPNIRDEVDVRLILPEQDGIESLKAAEKLFRAKVREFYLNDPDFADSLQMVMVSYKQDRKLAGQMTDANPISVREDGYIYTRKDVKSLTAKDLPKLCGNDGDLRDSLTALLAGSDKKVEDILKAQGKDTFVTQKGRIVRKVTVKGDEAKQVLSKEITPNNKSFYANNSYLCLEIYRKTNGEVDLRGIPYSAVYRSKKGTEIRDQKPDDFAEHLLYLRKHDYIEFEDKNGNLKFSGTFISTFNVNQRRICIAYGSRVCNARKPISISKTDCNFRKISYDILGKRGGVVDCGELLL